MDATHTHINGVLGNNDADAVKALEVIRLSLAVKNERICSLMQQIESLQNENNKWKWRCMAQIEEMNILRDEIRSSSEKRNYSTVTGSFSTNISPNYQDIDTPLDYSIESRNLKADPDGQLKTTVDEAILGGQEQLGSHSDSEDGSSQSALSPTGIAETDPPSALHQLNNNKVISHLQARLLMDMPIVMPTDREDASHFIHKEDDCSLSVEAIGEPEYTISKNNHTSTSNNNNGLTEEVIQNENNIMNSEIGFSAEVASSFDLETTCAVSVSSIFPSYYNDDFKLPPTNRPATISSPPTLPSAPGKVWRSSHKCPVCEKVCHSRSALSVHMRIHTGEKPFQCSDCDYRCSVKWNLTKHIQYKHRVETRPFSCQFCDRGFVTRRELKSHCLNRHGSFSELHTPPPHPPPPCPPLDDSSSEGKQFEPPAESVNAAEDPPADPASSQS